MKTKAGVSATLLAAGVYFAALFGSYVPVVLLAGYILIAEDNQWLRRTAVKATILMIVFDLLGLALNFIPNYFLDFIYDIVRTFNGHFDYSVVSNIFVILSDVLRICEVILFVALGFMSLKMKDIKLGAVDKLTDDSTAEK